MSAVLLQRVYDHFLAAGEWPKLDRLQVDLRYLGYLPRLAAEIGRDLIICENAPADAECQLTLKGVRRCRGSAGDIRNFIFAVRMAAEQYIAAGHLASISISDIAAELALSEIETKRLNQLVFGSQGIWSGASRDNEGRLTITPSRNIWYFEHVQTLEEYFSTLDQMERDAVEVARSQYAGWGDDPGSDIQHRGQRLQRLPSWWTEHGAVIVTGVIVTVVGGLILAALL